MNWDMKSAMIKPAINISRDDLPKIVLALSLDCSCNNQCRTCVCESRGAPPRNIGDILAEAAAARPYVNGFMLTDGEPTLVEELPALLSGLKELNPEVLQVCTNARMMMYEDYVRRLLRVKGVDYVVRLYGCTPRTHNACTGVAGSMKQSLRGLRNMVAGATDGIGIYVEIPLTRDNAAEAAKIPVLCRSLGVHGLIVSGGLPGERGAKLEDHDAGPVIEGIFAAAKNIPVFINYASDDQRFSREYPQAVPSERSGLWLCGADTNNPFLFRKNMHGNPKILFLNVPFSWGNNKGEQTFAPAPVAMVKGFSDFLGYPGKIIDLEALAKLRPGDFRFVFDKYDKARSGTGVISRQASKQAFSRLLDAGELRGRDVIWVCSRMEIYNNFDIPTHVNQTYGLGDFLKEAAPDSVLAFEHIEQAPGETFHGIADYVCAAPVFGLYSLGGILNRIEYGDRARTMVFNNITQQESVDVECNLSLLTPPSFGDLNIEPYFAPMPASLTGFLEEQGLQFDRNVRVGNLNYFITKGCRFGCIFCGGPFPFQAMDPRRTAEDLAALCRSAGLKCISFQDRVINNDEKFLECFCETLIRLGSPFFWSANARPVFKNRNLPKLMRDSGCVMLTFALESGSDDVLKRLNKGFTSGESQTGLKRAAGQGIVTLINLLSGSPHETTEDVAATLDFLARNRKYIDFINSHTSFTWAASVKCDPGSAGVRLRKFRGRNQIGDFHPYDEIGGRTWEEIVEFKEWAFVQIEKTVEEIPALDYSKRDISVFHIFNLGFERDMVRRFLAYIEALKQSLDREKQKTMRGRKSRNTEVERDAVLKDFFHRTYRFNNGA